MSTEAPRPCPTRAMGQVVAIGEQPGAGRELAWVMADALAGCGRYRGALAHLDAAESDAPLPEEYERKRSAWEARRP